MSEFTPTPEEVRTWYSGAVDEYRCDTGLSLEEDEEAFDRWLASVQAEAWEQGHKAGKTYGFSHGLNEEPTNPYQENQ